MTFVSGLDGSPSIKPLDLGYDALDATVELSADEPDGPALLLAHRESEDMSELMQLSIRGEVAGGVFRELSRSGSLTAAGGDSEWSRRKKASKARKMMRGWPEMPV